MLTDEIIDEDIEALLYAQVYYGRLDSLETQQPQVNLNKENTDSENPITCPQDYLNCEGQENDFNLLENPTNSTSDNLDQNNSLDIDKLKPIDSLDKQNNCDLIVNNQNEDLTELSMQPIETLTSLPNSDENDIQTTPQQQTPNNIPLNPYVQEDFLNSLKVYKENLIWSKQCERNLRRLQRGRLREKDFFKILDRKLDRQKTQAKKQELIRRVIFKRQQKIAACEVICLSDSDNSDIEIIETPKAMKSPETEHHGEGDSEDDIIYLPPPPVPVIDVDDESSSDKDIEQPLSDNKPSQEQDDFLAPTNTSETFNFSLHGSEFQDAEFVRPANPTDTYETESSTSTSDFNRESTCVKTIVFNEVGFPKEDIFEGNDLDKFGELITTNRSTSRDIDDKLEETDDNVKSLKRINPRASSESSSESDYGGSEVNQNLPALSPMVSNGASSKKDHKSKSGTPKNKRRKDANEGIIDANSTKITTRISKRRSSGLALESDVPKKKVKKKKKNKNADDLHPSATETKATPEPPRIKITPKVSNGDQTESSKKKNKKKKKQLDGDNIEDSDKNSAKRKKRSSKSVEENIDEPVQSDNNKKKQKKRKQKLLSEGQVDKTSDVAQDPQIPPVVEDQQPEEAEQPYESRPGEKVLVESQEQQDEEDLVLIEQDIPVHTVDSSTSDDDILSLEDVGDEVELANIGKGHIKSIEELDVKLILSKMSDDPEKWKILPVDQCNINIGKRIRCNKCRQFGHIAIHCPNKPSVPKCSLCGFEGHEEPRCPNKVCFNCGRPGSYSTVFCYKCSYQKKGMCKICLMPGHLEMACPDLWRRYYLTTKEGRIVKPSNKPKNVLKPRSKRWCSGCAAQGHLEFECDSYKWLREYPVYSPQIFRFTDVYERQKKAPPKRTDLRDKLLQSRANSQQAESPNENVDKAPENLPNAETQQPPAILAPPEPQIQSPPRGGRRWNSSRQNSLPGPQRPNRGYTNSYPSVLNPLSLLGVNSGLPFMGNGSMLNQAPFGIPPVGLFNPIPDDVLTQQLSNLLYSVTDYQGLQNPNQREFGQNPPYNSQIQLAHPSNNYTDFSQPFPNLTPYQENYSNRDYLDVPYTITREPGQNFPHNRVVQYAPTFPRENRHTTDSSSNVQGFIPLAAEENVDAFKPKKLLNVTEVTAKKFTHSSIEDLNAFLTSEMEKLDNIKTADAKMYKKKLNNIDQLQKIELKTNAVKKQIYFLYKHLNMFLFGIRKLEDGKRNLDYLRNFICSPGRFLNVSKRDALLEAYGYIFGGEHPNFNYRRHLNTLTVSQRHGKNAPP